jgi:hypothetical protein
MGYLTAYDEKTDLTYSILGHSDSNAIAAWLYNYCSSHPLENVSEAVHPLIGALYPRSIDKHGN